MVRYGQQVGWYQLFKLQLGLQRGLRSACQTYACRHTKDVGIHRHHLLLPHHSTHHIGGLATHAGQALQLLQITGHLATELLD